MKADRQSFYADVAKGLAASAKLYHVDAVVHVEDADDIAGQCGFDFNAERDAMPLWDCTRQTHTCTSAAMICTIHWYPSEENYVRGPVRISLNYRHFLTNKARQNIRRIPAK